MNLSQITPFLLYSFSSENDLVKNIEKLSVNFTSKREEIADYLENEKLVAAYTAFYLTTNYPKFHEVMSYLRNYLDDLRHYEWIDIGCGPGTFLFAIQDYFGTSLSSLFGIETSSMMRQQAHKIKEGLYPNDAIYFYPSLKDFPSKKKKRIVLFGHSANEMGNEKVLEYIQTLEADAVLFIEPGTKSFFKQYLSLRDKLIQSKFNCLYPCPNNSECPLGKQDDWCHQYVKVNHPMDVDRLTQLTRKNRKWLPLIIGLYSKTMANDWTDHSARIIRTYPSTKFSLEWDTCLLTDGQNVNAHFQLLKRDYTKPDLKIFENYLAGQRVEFKFIKKIDDHNSRVKII